MLLELGAALRLLGWEHCGLYAHLDAGLPPFGLAIRDAFRRLAAPGVARGPLRDSLAYRVLVLFAGRFAWSGREDLDAEVALGEADEDALLEGLADFLWEHRPLDIDSEDAHDDTTQESRRASIRRSTDKQEISLPSQLEWAFTKASRDQVSLDAAVADLQHVQARRSHSHEAIRLDDGILAQLRRRQSDYDLLEGQHGTARSELQTVAREIQRVEAEQVSTRRQNPEDQVESALVLLDDATRIASDPRRGPR